MEAKMKSQSNSGENNENMQSILSIDKGYISAAKSLLFAIVRNHNKMAIDSVHSSLTGTTRSFEKVFSMLASESFLRAIENGHMKVAREFLKSSWNCHARRYEASCVKLIERNFLLNIYNNPRFEERAIQFAAKNKNAKAFSLITSALFLKAVETGDKYSVKRFLNGSKNERSMRFETLCIKSFDRKFIVNVDAFDMDSLLGCCISFSDWLEGIAISPRRILLELLKFEKIVDGVTKNGWTALHLVLFQCQNEFEARERTILTRLLEFKNFELNALCDEMETLLHFILHCSVPYEKFSPFMRKLLKHKVKVKPRNSFIETALGVDCDADAILEMLNWKNYYGESLIPNFSAIDESRQTALSSAKQSSNAEIIVAMIEQNLFLRAVEIGDIETVKTYLTAIDPHFEVLYCRAKTVKTYLTLEESKFELLYRRVECDIFNDHHEHNYKQMKIQPREDNLIEKSPRKRLEKEIEAQRFTFKVSITRSVWFDAVVIAQHECHYEILNLLYNDDRFIHGFNKDGQTILHQVVADYFASKYRSRELNTVKILLKSGKFSANILNLQNETVFEFLCKIGLGPQSSLQLRDLLLSFHQNGIDLNDRNQNGETFLMLSCKNKRVDIVRELLDLTSRGFCLDIDAPDNSGKTAIMKAKEQDFSEIVVTLIRFKLISAVKQENVDMIKSALFYFRNTSGRCFESWNSVTFRDVMNENVQIYAIWRDAMFIAMKNDTEHSEEILKLLLDCDIQEENSGFPELLRGNDDEMRLIELLLESGKINVNARSQRGMTALHWAEEEKLISLLIRYGAGVNKRDNDGKTPLMWASRGTSEQELAVLRIMLEEAGTLLDAMDCNGRTALMHAVMESKPYAAELLLNAGVSVNLSDHLGFTAIHYALYRNNTEHAEFPRNYKELKKRKEMTILFDAGKFHEQCRWFIENNEWTNERIKIVEILLRRSDIDVNALSFEKFSPLDIAEGTIPQIPSSIKDALKEKGAVLNVFRQTESQSTSEFYLDIRCRLMLHDLVVSSPSTDEEEEDPLDFFKERSLALLDPFKRKKERFFALIEKFKDQIVAGKDQKGRTALHLVAISFYTLRRGKTIHDCMINLSNAIMHQLISLGCNVNEIDIFGRTPLHYASKSTRDLLVSYGADASIKDKDGHVANNEAPLRSSNVDKILKTLHFRNKERYFLRLVNNKQIEINVQHVDTQGRTSDDRASEDTSSASEFWQRELNFETAPRLLWEKGEYAFRHPLAEQITKDVRDLMASIAREIERLDPRFAIRVEFVGGSNEGTKTDDPEEFDFCFVLTKISELCEVSQSPELPAGFVRLKRRSTKVDETRDYNGLFREDGMLNTDKLNKQFTAILLNAVINTENHQNFEWILELMPFLEISHKVGKVISIGMHIPTNFTSVDFISIDIVPCIHVDGWWPDEAISNVSDNIKKSGCNLVIDRPQNLYHWFQYSESCARISFSKAESDMIKQSCDNAREAYMIGKTMVEKSGSNSKYILKTCLLYCIEALTPTSEKAFKLGLSFEELKSKFHQMDRYLWLKCLMKCHLVFVVQAFCPYYFLPNVRSLIGVYLQKTWIQYCTNDAKATFPDLCEKAYALYRWTSSDSSESCLKLPGPDPLWEHFDRKQLIQSLGEIAYK